MVASRRHQCTGDRQAGGDGQETNRESDAPAFALDELDGLADHDNLRVEKVQSGGCLWRSQGALPKALQLEDGVAAREERPGGEKGGEKGGDDGTATTALEHQAVSDRHLGSCSQAHENARETEDDPRLRLAEYISLPSLYILVG